MRSVQYLSLAAPPSALFFLLSSRPWDWQIRIQSPLPAGAATCGYDPRSFSPTTPISYVLAGTDLQKSTPASFFLAHGLAHSASSLFTRRLLITLLPHAHHASRTLPTFAHPSPLSLPHYPTLLIPPLLHVYTHVSLCFVFRSHLHLVHSVSRSLGSGSQQNPCSLDHTFMFPTSQFMFAPDYACIRRDPRLAVLCSAPFFCHLSYDQYHLFVRATSCFPCSLAYLPRTHHTSHHIKPPY